MEEIHQARKELIKRGLDFTNCEPWRTWLPFRFLQKIGIVREPYLPSPIKSWDVLLTVDLILKLCQKDELVLDLGSKNSEILPCLSALGFRRLFGIDLDPSVVKQPNFGCIQWVHADFCRSDFQSERFSVITAISTIEHGMELERLCVEASRLLRSGGLFVFTTDYNESKLDTTKLSVFGCEWVIFYRDEIEELMGLMFRYGLKPLSGVQMEQSGTPIHWMDKDYTFLFAALMKSNNG